jgi:hypothetical protein
MFCGRVGHLDEFSRIERRCLDYAKNSYRDEFFYFLPRSYSRVVPCSSSRALPQFAHGPNYHSYGFGSRENCFEPRCFSYGPRPHRDDRFLRMPIFPVGVSHTHFELRYLDGPHFSRRGSRTTRSSDVVQRIVKTSFGRMVKY